MTRGLRRRDRGAALVLAIGAAVTLATLATATVRQGRDTVVVATIALEAAQARAAAEAGVVAALAALAGDARGGPAGASIAAGPWRSRFEGFELTVGMSLERGRVDLNRATPATLALAARAAGAAQPDAFAESVARRRAAAGGLSWRLAPRAFDSVADARALVETDVWPALSAMLTVHGAPAPDPRAAPPPLARALMAPPGVARAGVGDVVRVTAQAHSPGRVGAAVGALARLGAGQWRIVAWDVTDGP